MPIKCTSLLGTQWFPASRSAGTRRKTQGAKCNAGGGQCTAGQEQTPAANHQQGRGIKTAQDQWEHRDLMPTVVDNMSCDSYLIQGVQPATQPSSGQTPKA